MVAQVNLGRAMAKIGRILDDLKPEEQQALVAGLAAIYGKPEPPSAGAIRTARWRARRASHGDVTGDVTSDVTRNGHSDVTAVTHPPAPPDVSPVSLSLLEQETTGARTKPDPEKIARRETARRILAFLNEKTGKSFREKPDTHLVLIEARLKDGMTEANLRGIIARKCADWLDDPKTRVWLRPATLFRASNAENYLGERRAGELPAPS